ncbi:helix-turn-helix domain-containing protein [Flavobacterium sp.]|uniref:helix-turn-helix domain-containing protein n=1 Tax=Flavobacterium sp. TaxID=239 RepID=UPI00286DBF7D|nr:helix-turn-helix domain-containing protein [Flavobacterium sp.]
MEMVVERIKDIRKKKGFSHEYMAHLLDMSQPAYSKIENSETKLSVERLFKISEILETPVEDFLNINPNNIYNQTLNDNAIIYQDFENLYQDNKEKTEKIAQLYEARLQDKNDAIIELKKIIEKLS